MAKALPPGEITTRAGRFTINVLPDPFDERDLEYRPRLQPLPARLNQRKNEIVLEQQGSSCVGHALAAMVNTILAHAPDAPARPVRVSPYMLYWLARRYDEFEGEEDIGSSLRGGLKGWFHHGCAIEREWPTLAAERSLDDPEFQEHCSERPLGAFYRINPYRLDDMQSAINELNVIVASAAIHNGWEEPQALRKGRETVHTIVRPIDPRALGGHAFALVGYNEVGFLVQNSWGTRWGKGGFATLPYEDWLDSAYDAWVARPGVPRTPFASGRNRVAMATDREIATGPGPDLRRLKSHVVNLGNDGKLSKQGKFVSSPAQIEEIFRHMDEVQRDWAAKGAGTTRRVVLYAHGGLVSEAGGLATAEKHLNWWMNNRVYPVYFAWQTGPAETLVNQLVDTVRSKLPFGGVGFDLAEQVDRLVEKVARTNFRWMWDEMKENARRASAPLPGSGISWPPQGNAGAMEKMPGASLTVDRLAKYIKDVKAQGGKVAVHLVGHSAGGVFNAALLQRLAQARIQIETLSLLAPGNRIDEFERDVLPKLGAGKTVRRTGLFVLSDRRELDDTVGTSGIKVYQKSLLYLVARALERLPDGERFEVPVLGMERFLDPAFRTDFANAGGDIVVAPSEAAQDGSSDSQDHSGFDDDSPTMTAVVLRILGKTEVSRENVYRPHAALSDLAPAAEPLLPRAAAAAPPGESPVVEMAAVPAAPPMPPRQKREPVVEVAAAPRSGSPILDMMLATGWKPAGSEAGRKAAKKRG